jgi:hypothetical protein
MAEQTHDGSATNEVADTSGESSYTDETPLAMQLEAHASQRRPAVSAAVCLLVAAGLGGWLAGHARKHSARQGNSVKTVVSNSRPVTRRPAGRPIPTRDPSYPPNSRRGPKRHHRRNTGAATSRVTRGVETTVVTPPVSLSPSVRAAPGAGGQFAPGTFSYLGR